MLEELARLVMGTIFLVILSYSELACVCVCIESDSNFSLYSYSPVLDPQ